MKKQLISFGIATLIFAFIVIAASPVTDSHGVNLGTCDAATINYGANFTANYDLEINEYGQATGSDATHLTFVQCDDDGQTPIQIREVTGVVNDRYTISPAYQMNESDCVIILTGKNGASYTRCYSAAGQSKMVGTGMSWGQMRGNSSGTLNSNDRYYNWYNITTTRIIPTGDPDPIISQTFDNTTTEGDNYSGGILFENYNMTNNSSVNLIYEGVYYNTTQTLINSSYVFFNFSVFPSITINNTSTDTFSFNYTIVYENESSPTIAETSNNTVSVSWNLTSYPRVNITAFDRINGVYLSSFSITDGTTELSTTNNDLYYYKSSGGNYELTIDAGGSYETRTQNVTFTAGSFLADTFYLYTHNSVNFSFYSEINNTLLINSNITVEFISDSFSYNYTAINGTLYADLLSPETYTIRYSSDGYGRIREYYLALTNRSHNNLTLYLLNDDSSTETVITTYEQTTLNLIEGAIVYLQRYFQDENVYKTVAMYSSDIAGKSYFDIEHDNELYKFVVDYPYQTVKLTTEPLYISETALNLYISLLTDSTETFFNEVGIGYTLTYDETNNEFDLTYNDAGNIATNYCLSLKRWGQYSKIIINSSCSTANSGSISISGLTGNYTYYGVFTATIDGIEKVQASAWKTIFNDKSDFGDLGVFMTAIILMIVAFLSAVHIYSLIMVSIGLVLANIMGLIPIGWGGIIVIIIASLILAMIIQMKK